MTRSLFAIALLAAAVSGQIGLTELTGRLGVGNVPTGAGIVVGQVEAGSTPYGPNQSLAEFAGKTFTPHSGTPGSAGHATSVGRKYYGAVNSSGVTTSVAPGITDIHLWNANSWIQGGFLQVGFGSTPPAVSPGGLKLFNHSWIGSFPSTSNNNSVLRRADHVMTRDGVLMMCGVNNGSSSSNPPFMSHVYNGLAVGRSDGNHAAGPTSLLFDGAGRMKPEIVAPSSATSFATPMVAAAAALMVETARTDATVIGNPNAELPEVVKAVLLAGARHRAGWSNNPDTTGPTRGITATPLDPVFGVDEVEVNRSHLILTGGEQDGLAVVPAQENVTRRGFDHATVPVGGSLFWRFAVHDPSDEVSIVACWNRETSTSFTTSVVADFDLILHAVDAQGLAQSLVGGAGIGVFDGNVMSQSIVDNVEHLYLTDLVPGDYVLELVRQDTLAGVKDAAVAWLLPDAPFPGSGEDFELETLVNGAGDPLTTTKTVFPGDSVTVRILSPGGTFDSSVPLLGGVFFPVGFPPTSPPAFPEVHLNGAVLILFDGFAASPPIALPSGGITFSGSVLPGFTGIVIRLQAFAASSLATNGIFASSGARDIEHL